MIVRFRGKEGMYRVSAPETWSLVETLSELEKQLPPHSGQITINSTPTGNGETYQESWTYPLGQLGIKHGDMLFFDFISEGGGEEPEVVTTDNTQSFSSEDPLDSHLASLTGRINREQTSLCTHGPKGMCEYCQPLEPWDEEYQHTKGIKHVSIHAWRKKTKEEGGFLEAPNYSLDKTCTNGHLPYPRGFCSRCQPPAITLQQQKFRMVDHVEFASPKIMENFIEFWRQTNNQRIGFLIGKYSSYEDNVPLGIKAEVHAIYEPQQIDDVDSLLLQELPTKNAIKAAKLLGLQIVGVIFTDLVDSREGNGKVITKRHLNSYFLSSLEVLFAARMQNEFPHRQYNDPDGANFSSRFVTCCVSGNEFGDIDVACYQTSLQGEAMARADLIMASTNPSVMRINESTDNRYVPDIFYKLVNEYKLTVQENAKPAFPVDYLLVSLSHGFKNVSIEEALSAPQNFTIENRPQLKSQTPSQVVDFLQLDYVVNPDRLRDFHLLLYLLSLDVLQPSDTKILEQLLIASAANEDPDQITSLSLQFAQGAAAQTLKMLAA